MPLAANKSMMATEGTKPDEEVTRLELALKNAFSTVNILILILVMVAMGAKLELKHLKAQLKKPTGPIAGFLSQFALLPFIAFIISYIANLEEAHKIGALIMCCSPGGVMSNMITYYTEGDCSLSITMTLLSTLLAFPMMPANLWLYTRSWNSDTDAAKYEIPYANILLSLILILIPVAFGYFLGWLFPDGKVVVARTGSMSGGLAFLISMVLFCFMHGRIFKSEWWVWIAASLMPLLGFSLGFILASIMCLSWKQCRTVGFETGCQNFSICFSVISTSFTTTQVADMLLLPLMFCLFMFIEGWLLAVVYYVMKSFKRCTDADEYSDDYESTSDVSKT